MTNIFCESENCYNKLKQSFSDLSGHSEKYFQSLAPQNPEETFNELWTQEVNV